MQHGFLHIQGTEGTGRWEPALGFTVIEKAAQNMATTRTTVGVLPNTLQMPTVNKQAPPQQGCQVLRKMCNPRVEIPQW